MTNRVQRRSRARQEAAQARVALVGFQPGDRVRHMKGRRHGRVAETAPPRFRPYVADAWVYVAWESGFFEWVPVVELVLLS